MSLSRRVVDAVAAAALVVALPAGAAAAASQTTRASLIFDDAHILDDGQVVHDINALRNKTGVEVAVLTTGDGADVHKDTYDDDVLTYLEQHDDKAVLDSDGDGLRDGLILVAVSPDVREVGVYAGDDVDLDADGVQEVVDAVRPDARAERWDAVAVGGAKKALAVTAAGSTASEPDEPDLTPVDPDPTPAADLGIGPILGILGGLGVLVGGPFAAIAVVRRRRRRAAQLAWTPDPAAVSDALRQWREAIEQVQMTGYPEQPRDRSGRAAWTYDPADAVATLEAVAAVGPTLAQRVQPGVHARLVALLEPQRTLAAWVGDAHFWSRAPGWEQRWAAEFDRLAAGPLSALRGSVDELTGDRPSRRLVKVREGVDQLDAVAARLDEAVRSGAIRPTAGVVEAKALHTQVREFAADSAAALGRGMPDRAKRSLGGQVGGADASLSPFLLTGLIASSASQQSFSAQQASAMPGSGFGASTTFTDTSGGGGMTGGSGGFRPLPRSRPGACRRARWSQPTADARRLTRAGSGSGKKSAGEPYLARAPVLLSMRPAGRRHEDLGGL